MEQQPFFDPFACLDYHLYVSGRLTLFRAASCGEWICPAYLAASDVPPLWHRRLTAQAFLWLRDRVQAAIRSGTIAKDFAEARTTLEWVKVCGIEHGSFTADELAHTALDELWSFNDGLPAWADTAEF